MSMKNNGRKVFFAIVSVALANAALIVMAGASAVTR
jgi:hypothetical protein